MSRAKPFDIPKREVWEAFKRVKANQGAAGVDGQSVQEFEAQLVGNLYKLWNRLSSGSYLPPPVRRVDIPKANGGTRPLGIPTVLIALRKRLFGGIWSHCWNQSSMRTLMGIGRGDRRLMEFGRLASDAGDTTGLSILISRLSLTVSIGNSCYARCESTRSAGGFCSISSVG